MSELNKNFEPYKIPIRNQLPNNETGSSSKDTDLSISFDDRVFAEIEINGSGISSFKPVSISKPIPTVTDERRKIFNSMRDISRNDRSSFFLKSNFYHKHVQDENSKIFYKQALFMKDFEDDYAEAVSLSSYFPNYQMMDYEQLRTYFTWRTGVRNGRIENTSLSYAFVYIYELLNNIGTNDPQDGLCKLMTFRETFKAFDTKIDKYLIKWLKDYHIYYELPNSFKDFIIEHNLQSHYPDMLTYEPDTNENFERLCCISKYNIKQSSFYNEETNALINDCFDFVIGKLKNTLSSAGIYLNELLYQPAKSKSDWVPFSGALFYSKQNQPDRQVMLSENEVYICSQNKWQRGKIITTDSGKQLIGYILKQTEAVLRNVTKYKNKLSANPNTVNVELIRKLEAAGIYLEKEITDSVLEYYREANKTVDSVNESILNRIRLEALDAQEMLNVPENDARVAPVFTPKALPPVTAVPHLPTQPPIDENVLPDSWTSFKNALSDTELNALSALLNKSMDIKQLADENGIMLEVLADSINEKAVDHIGDNILEPDDGMKIYDEYREKIIIMVRR